MKLEITFFNWRKALAVSLFVFSLTSVAERERPAASFASFDARAHAGNRMSVVFFGGSLTWGDGASDPERTSFRALLENYLQQKYPSAKFIFHDAAIGGTGSTLGMFRVDRDVLARKPDLVFMDFTIEDKLAGTDRETLASYERILRDLIYEGVPVVQILLGTKNYFGPDWTHLGPARFRDHLEMGNLYHTGVGNSFPVIQNFLRNELNNRDQIWPEGEMYPSDLGHRFIFEAARDGLEKAIRNKRLCNWPRDAVFADEYKNRLQVFPTSPQLPGGWRIEKTLRPTLEAVELANGWMNEVALCDVSARESAKPLQINFNGTFVGILGEADENGLGFKVFVDGHPIFYKERPEDDVWPTSSVPFGGGERFFWHKISDKLKPGRHTVEIQPVFPEGSEQGALRIESICVAGPDPDATQNLSSAPVKF
ncbi:MAG: SGNH/GDSL hydrolase family protein [Verrucomicrobiota bacterium]